jgi:hypothetical protein
LLELRILLGDVCPVIRLEYNGVNFPRAQESIMLDGAADDHGQLEKAIDGVN